jgi:hypothetical protein
MAAVLGITVPWRLDGHSALDTTHPERKGKIMVGPLWGPESALPWKAGRLTFPTDEGIRCLTSDRPNPDVAWGDGPQRVFRRGPYGALLGRPVNETNVVAPAGSRIVFTGDDPTAPYAADADEVPCVIEGDLTVPDGAPTDRDLLIAINGIIEATGRSASYPNPQHADTATFVVAVPAAAFRDGRNEIQVLLPQGDGAATRLVPADIATAAASRP